MEAEGRAPGGRRPLAARPARGVSTAGRGGGGGGAVAGGGGPRGTGGGAPGAGDVDGGAGGADAGAVDGGRDHTDTASADAETAAYAPCPPKGRACAIMPLGDSITEGYRSSGGGYRPPLFHLALQDGK